MSRRGGGTRVQSAARRSAREIDQQLDQHASALVQRARLLGVDDDRVRAAVERALHG